MICWIFYLVVFNSFCSVININETLGPKTFQIETPEVEEPREYLVTVAYRTFKDIQTVTHDVNGKPLKFKFKGNPMIKDLHPRNLTKRLA